MQSNRLHGRRRALWPLLPAAAASFLLLGVAMAFSPRDRVPERFAWEFSVGPRLQRDGAYAAVTRVPVWSDPQRAPEPGFDFTPQTVLIGEDELASVWQQITALDLHAYAALGEDAFVPLPPDVAGPERLRVEVAGKVEVDLVRDAQALAPRWRQPLLAVARSLDGLFERRLADPLLPRELRLRVEHATTSTVTWAVLTRTAGTARAQAGGGAVQAPAVAADVPPADIAALWRWLLEARLADRTFAAQAPAAPAAPTPPTAPGTPAPARPAAGPATESYAVELRIEGHALPGGRASGDFEGRAMLDQLLARLQELARR